MVNLGSTFSQSCKGPAWSWASHYPRDSLQRETQGCCLHFGWQKDDPSLVIIIVSGTCGQVLKTNEASAIRTALASQSWHEEALQQIIPQQQGIICTLHARAAYPSLSEVHYRESQTLEGLYVSKVLQALPHAHWCSCGGSICGFAWTKMSASLQPPASGF